MVLAEGATGSFFDTFFLIENPNTAAVTVRATYLLYTGVSFQKDYVVAGNTRFTLGANSDDPQLANTAFSTKFETLGGEGIIVERSMWWPATLPWIEGHDSAGVTATGTMWAVAEGEIGARTTPRPTCSSPTPRRSRRICACARWRMTTR